MIELFVFLFWLCCLKLGYQYLRSLMNDLGCWNSQSRTVCFLIAVAGPAAVIAGLAVDFSRPIV